MADETEVKSTEGSEFPESVFALKSECDIHEGLRKDEGLQDFGFELPLPVPVSHEEDDGPKATTTEYETLQKECIVKGAMAQVKLHAQKFITNLEQYRTNEHNKLRVSQKKLDYMFLDTISRKLEVVGIAAHDKDKRMEMARGILFHNKKYAINADHDISEEKRQKFIQDIYSLYQLRLDIKNYAFLLISAPNTCTQTLDGVNLSLQQDMTMRKSQFDKFVSAVVHAIDPEDPKVTFERVTVHNRTSLEQATEQFLRLHAKKALHAMVVFNGHGCPDGLQLQGDTGFGLPLNNYITWVHRNWQQYLHNETDQLAVRIYIVFAQCFGHMHSGSPDYRIYPTSFTNVDETSTYNVLDITCLDNAEHQELQDFAPHVNADLKHLLEQRRVAMPSTELTANNTQIEMNLAQLHMHEQNNENHQQQNPSPATPSPQQEPASAQMQQDNTHSASNAQQAQEMALNTEPREQSSRTSIHEEPGELHVDDLPSGRTPDTPHSSDMDSGLADSSQPH